MFKDKSLEENLTVKGFAILPQIDEEQLHFFKNMYELLHKDNDQKGHISTAFSKDLEYKDNCNKELIDFFSNIIGQYFESFEIYGTSFVYKTPSADSALRPHQDWSLTDEEIYQQFNFWIPLCDIDETNGMMYVIPGTQYKRFPFVRATNVDYYYELNREVVVKHGIPLKVKAGTVIVFDNSIIHYSEPNMSTSDRVAAVCTFYEAGAPSMMFYHDKKNKKMNSYFAEKGFALKYKDFFNDIQRPPDDLPLHNAQNFRMPKYSDYELNQIFNELRVASGFSAITHHFPKPSLLSTMKRYIMERIS